MSAWLGQRYEDIWMQSSGTGRYCSEKSTIAS
jgi:hypothetical protein